MHALCDSFFSFSFLCAYSGVQESTSSIRVQEDVQLIETDERMIENGSAVRVRV